MRVAIEANPSRNVVAEKPGTGGQIVILRGRYEAVPNVVGSRDNGSCTAVLLTLALELSNTISNSPCDLLPSVKRNRVCEEVSCTWSPYPTRNKAGLLLCSILAL